MLLSLCQDLEAFDMLEERVEKDETLRGEGMSQNLVGEVARLHSHLDLLDQNGHRLVEGRERTSTRAPTTTTL